MNVKNPNDRKEVFWRPFVICAFELLSSFVIRASSFIQRVPAGKFVFLPVDKTPHGREETAAYFRRDWWRGFFRFALGRSVAGGRPSRHRDRQPDHGQHRDHWPPRGPRASPYHQAQRFHYHFLAAEKTQSRITFRTASEPDCL